MFTSLAQNMEEVNATSGHKTQERVTEVSLLICSPDNPFMTWLCARISPGWKEKSAANKYQEGLSRVAVFWRMKNIPSDKWRADNAKAQRLYLVSVLEVTPRTLSLRTEGAQDETAIKLIWGKSKGNKDHKASLCYQSHVMLRYKHLENWLY